MFIGFSAYRICALQRRDIARVYARFEFDSVSTRVVTDNTCNVAQAYDFRFVGAVVKFKRAERFAHKARNVVCRRL